MPSLPIPKWLLVVCISAALLGFADSSYLTAEHVRGVIPPCGASSQCDQVLVSKYSSVGPIPVSALGMAYYGAVLLLLIIYLDSGSWRAVHLAAWVISAGMLGTLYFIAVQAFILHAWCLYCLFSAAMTCILFFCGLRIMRID